MIKRKIVEYDILSEPYSHELVAEVNSQIAKGWQPIGEMKIDAATYYYQVMVRYWEKGKDE